MTRVPPERGERPRPHEQHGDPEAWERIVPHLEYGRMFSQMFADDEQFPEHAAGSAGASRVTVELAMIGALTDQLMPRFSGVSQWPLQVALYVPRLGRIRARVQREREAWGIELQAEQDTTARWLTGVRQCCQSRMVEILGHPVNLQVIDGTSTC
ncbi:type III secretion protein HrpP [Pseudomonas orientalis]|uniref:type III secretion system HrpP C-terminal domain-containing protein n=1 Tax=Pseudomonas orientalis TaxID=76758 RepID=UPI000F587528|nr:type III secretion system HrpP C-terminal domain-containing protein [Pseudomonas orientalis]AZE92837.1 type III secretion protein HrpP [Pseudomonas orientalis]AZE98190.1 type III secretion protein HrpP [Pseudomonas orientalis]